MKNRSRQLFIPLVCIFAIAQSLNAQEPKAGKPKQFIYVLRLVPRLHADSAWTKEDNAALERHFTRFQDAAKSGQLILAGRTSESGDKTFGIAIFEAPDEDGEKIHAGRSGSRGRIDDRRATSVRSRPSTQESVECRCTIID
jgi:hypothetical protein